LQHHSCDEINRAPAKVQSALLEAMQDDRSRSASIPSSSKPVPRAGHTEPHRAGRNIPLPEAQLDRFMLKLRIDYPAKDEERKILERMAKTNTTFDVKAVIRPQEIIEQGRRR